MTLLQISELDNRCIRIIILWKFNIYAASVGPYNTFGVHCQCPVCGLSKHGFNGGCQCQIRPFELTGEHSINSVCYDIIKSKPLVCTCVQEPHMNSSLKDQMSSSLSRQKSGFGLDLLLKTVVCSNEVLWRLSYCPRCFYAACKVNSWHQSLPRLKDIMLKDQQRWGSIALTTVCPHCFHTRCSSLLI